MADPRFTSHFQANSPLAGAGVTLPQEMGFAAWSDPPGLVVTSAAGPAAAGVLALRRFSVGGALTITTAHIIIGTAGVTLTANQCWIGVWDGNGVLIGLSADQSVNFAGTGLVSAALTPGVAGPGTDTPYVYVGVVFNGTTSPFYLRSAAADVALLNGLAAVTVANARATTGGGGITTVGTVPTNLPAPTKSVSLNSPFWAAVS